MDGEKSREKQGKGKKIRKNELRWERRKGRKKEERKNELRWERRKGRKEKKERTEEQRKKKEKWRRKGKKKKRKKKWRVKSKVAIGGSLSVCFNYEKSITHYSKIRELSDGNKNLKQKPNILLSRGSHNFWVMGNGNRIMSQTAPKLFGR